MTDSKPVIDFIFRITNDILWNTFKKNEIGDVMLPFVVLRRMDCRLADKKENVRNTYLNFKDKVNPDKLDPILRKAAGGLQFYNTSKYDLKGLTQEPQNIEINFSNYLNGFNTDVRDIMEYFQLDKIIARLVKNNLLFQMVDSISSVDLSLENIDNHNMGYVFEELIRISNEQSNETAGEHFTPRDVIHLMIRILFSTEKETLKQPGVIRTVYDLACGTGGMLTLSKKYVLDEINPNAEIKIFGQEINEQSFAIAKSDLLITGEDADNIKHGNSFSDDKFQGRRFNYMLANPPYGVSWKKDENFIKNESLNPAGRFYAGLPRTSDGQLLFLQHMISKMEPNGSRIAVVTNGSPLFTGDAGSGESEIRKWIITNDWLDCIVALPKDLFYNTGIYTYIWFITNKKESHRKGKVQLINAVDFCRPEKKSLGNKRNKLYEDHLAEIEKIYSAFVENENSKIFANEYFGYYQVTIEQPEYTEKGKIKLDKNGQPKPDSKKRDTENIPLNEDINSYFAEEVKPHVPDAWIDFDKTRIGYEINFTRYFYKYQKPKPSAKIKSEIVSLESTIQELLKKVLI
jgi:type I restriction enzyme M protein